MLGRLALFSARSARGITLRAFKPCAYVAYIPLTTVKGAPGHREHEKFEKSPAASQWTAKEDDLLRKGIEKHGYAFFKIASEFIPHRTAKACHLRWSQALHPDLKMGKFTPEVSLSQLPWNAMLIAMVQEDARLVQLVAEHGPVWATVAEHLDGRTPSRCRERYPPACACLLSSDCSSRWTDYLDPSLPKRALFTEEEDAALLANPTDTTALSIQMHRTEKQITDRLRYLTTGKQIIPWSAEQEQALDQAVAQYGYRDWTKVAECVGKTVKQCRNKWELHCEQHVMDNSWSVEEDELLRARVQRFGTQWPIVAIGLVKKTGKECQQR